MHGYVATSPKVAQQGASERTAEHRTEVRTAAPAASEANADAAARPLSPTSRSLLQMREALDEGADVQSHLALQRALNERTAKPLQRKPNATGLPDRLKAGVESLSGLAMDDVRVHYNSPKSAAVQAHAYAQGTDIHVAPGQAQHLPHEAWHVVQQKQGRVKPTLQMKGIAINDDTGLEREADVMGGRALLGRPGAHPAAGLRPQSRGVSMARAAPLQAFMDLKEVQVDAKTVGYIKDNYLPILNDYHELLENLNQDPENNRNVAAITEDPILIGQILGESKLPDRLQHTYKAGDLMNIVQMMNAMESDVSAGKMSMLSAGVDEKDTSDIKIGTEFTFTHKDLATLSMDHKQAADPFMTKWTNLVVGQKTLKPEVTKASHAKYPKFAKTFTYTLGDKTTWCWTLDMDEACLETQTQPSTLAQFQTKHGDIRFIVDRDIFQAAQKTGLVPDGGGGHISIDARTTFGGSAEQLLVLLQQMQQKADQWDEYFKQTAEGDKLNAAWVGEMQGGGGQRAGSQLKPFLAETERLLGAVIEGKLDMFGAVQALMTFNSKMKNPIAENYKAKGNAAQKKAGTAVAREPHHYQAVNIEHMGAHEDAKSRRLELRRIGSQTDIAELLKQIEFIFARINEARKVVLTRLEKRGGDGTAAADTADSGTAAAGAGAGAKNAGTGGQNDTKPDKKK